MRDGALPNLIIIGAMKCATTSLHYYLGLHPQVGMSRRKELNFFVEERNWQLGEAWYRSWFSSRDVVRGEASPAYTAHPQFSGVPERMHRLIPDSKLIYVVRDPIARLLSQYAHRVAAGRETRSLAEVLDDPANPYLSRSRYWAQLERYLRLYPADHILVLQLEALRADRFGTMQRVFRFAGVDPAFRAARFRWERHRSMRKRRKTVLGQRLSRTWAMRLLDRMPMERRWLIEQVLYYPFSRPLAPVVLDGALRERVAEKLQPDIMRLREWTGERFGEWSI